MRIRTFYTKTMAEALHEIKINLGPEALILSTKEIPCRSGIGALSSGFEVVAAIDSPVDKGASFIPQRIPGTVRVGSDLPDAPPPGLQEAGEIDAGLYSPSSVLKQRNRTGAGGMRKKPLARKSNPDGCREAELPFDGATCLGLHRDLIESGVQEWLATKLVCDAVANLEPGRRRNKPAVLRSLAHVARSLISVAGTEDGMPVKKVVIFFGPSGVGKTTSIAKLAARLALQNKKKVVLMTLDGYRIGAVEHLRTYARLMGIPFRFVSRIADLPAALQEHGQRDYILIDTAGRGPRDVEEMRELVQWLPNSAAMERHLVLSATTKPDDLRKTVDRFELCKPDYLVFTKLDETSTLGPILNELVRTHKSLSYYTDGQKVPEDFHAVSGDRIIDMVLNQD